MIYYRGLKNNAINMSTEAVDLAELKDRLDGDKELFLEICEVFFADFAGHVDTMRASLAANMAEKLKDNTHTVKGALANLSVKNAATIAHEIEIAVGDKRISDLEPLITKLCAEIESFRAFVEKVKTTDIWDSK